jgi:hypothetical protein
MLHESEGAVGGRGGKRWGGRRGDGMGWEERAHMVLSIPAEAKNASMSSQVTLLPSRRATLVGKSVAPDEHSGNVAEPPPEPSPRTSRSSRIALPSPDRGITSGDADACAELERKDRHTTNRSEVIMLE